MNGVGKRLLVIGASGLIGAEVAAHLNAQGFAVTALGRDAAAARRLSFARWVIRDLATLRRPEDWQDALAGVDAVVNCAGLLQPSARDDLSAVHVVATEALVAAMQAAGIRRLVHISAVGIDGTADTVFSATKRAAETIIAASPLDWVILRPGLVLAPTAYGASALLRGIAALPFVMPLARPDGVARVVSSADVARAVEIALTRETALRQRIDLVAAEATTLGTVATALRGWLGLRPAPVLPLPDIVFRPVSWIADGLAHLGWRSPLRSTALAQLAVGIDGDASDAPRHLGFEPKDLASILAARPAGVQERWFARLYFVKPLALTTLSLFWLASGVIGLWRLPQAAALLEPLPLAGALAAAAALVDIALALMLLVRRLAPTALVAMVLVSLAYLAGASLMRPMLWLDPLGPLVKVLPSIVLALATAAMMDER